jgi:hypothetical protein
LTRSVSEPPLAFAARASAARPELSNEIRAITDAYARARYSDAPSDTLLWSLRHRVTRFAPQRAILAGRWPLEV